MPLTHPKRNRLLKIVAGIFLGLVLAAGGYAWYEVVTCNFHTVVPGQAYRSGQMDAESFSHCIQTYGIKSILNLRGDNSATSWHQAEIAVAARLNVAHYERSLGSGTLLTVGQMEDLVSLLRQVPKPVLIHCDGGADRSGLVSALYCLAIADQSPAQADRQLTIWYGHVPLFRPKVSAMDQSFWLYATHFHSQPVEPKSILGK